MKANYIVWYQRYLGEIRRKTVISKSKWCYLFVFPFDSKNVKHHFQTGDQSTVRGIRAETKIVMYVYVLM